MAETAIFFRSQDLGYAVPLTVCVFRWRTATKRQSVRILDRGALEFPLRECIPANLFPVFQDLLAESTFRLRLLEIPLGDVQSADELQREIYDQLKPFQAHEMNLPPVCVLAGADAVDADDPNELERLKMKTRQKNLWASLGSGSLASE